MGRPLKIQKYSTGSGEGQYQEGQGVAIDAGYPNNGSLTAPVYPNAMTATQFFGVVGGAGGGGTNSVASSTFPVVAITVYVAGAGSRHAGYIIRQKGEYKYLVADDTVIQDEDIVAGNTYIITLASNTKWYALGAAANAQVGDIFVATASGTGLGTGGQVNLVSTCVLVNSATPALGQMSIAMDAGAGTIYIKKLTNKFALDYSNVRYATNFFDTGDIVIKSGTSGSANVTLQQNRLALANVASYTS